MPGELVLAQSYSTNYDGYLDRLSVGKGLYLSLNETIRAGLPKPSNPWSETDVVAVRRYGELFFYVILGGEELGEKKEVGKRTSRRRGKDDVITATHLNVRPLRIKTRKCLVVDDDACDRDAVISSADAIWLVPSWDYNEVSSYDETCDSVITAQWDLITDMEVLKRDR